jgi:DNA-binding MarR family transcriptional regulator
MSLAAGIDLAGIRGDAERIAVKKHKPLSDEDYRALAAFRYTLRQFTNFSESAARSAGLTLQQHQALLAIRASDDQAMSIGALAAFLFIQPHSASELVNRLEAADLVRRMPHPQDRRAMTLRLTGAAAEALTTLSLTHRDELRRLRPMLTRLLAQLD